MSDEHVEENVIEVPADKDVADAGADTGVEEVDEATTPAAGEAQEPVEDAKQSKPGWLTPVIVVVALLSLCCAIIMCVAAASAILGSGGETPTQPETPKDPGTAYINIVEPADSAVVDSSHPVLVAGKGGALPEGNVVVQALDEYGSVLAEQATTVDAPDAGTGGEGPWQVKLSINVAPGLPGAVYAFATSPKDGSVIAEDRVSVTFGKASAVEAYIKINDPASGTTVDLANPVTVHGTGAGLPEGNVVVQALDQSGEVLVQQATIIQAPDAGTGGEGPWSVELSFETEPDTRGQIAAFSPSPVDGSIIAADAVQVHYQLDEGGETPEVEIEGKGWLLDSLGRDGVMEGTRITAEFRDGQIGGSAGCNNYFAPYEVSGQSLTIGAVGSTRMFCSEPPGVMEQESAYLGTLEQVTGYRLGGEKLELTDGGGAALLGYKAAVTGQATYLQRIALTEDAVVKVQVADVSLADAPAVVIGEQIIENPGQVPIPFEVTYDPSVIDERFTYAVQVRIEDGGGSLLFINTSAYQVITRGNPSLDVEVLVEPVQ